VCGDPTCVTGEPGKGLSNFRVDFPDVCVPPDQVTGVATSPVLSCVIFNNEQNPANECPNPVEGDTLKCDGFPDEFGKGTPPECATISVSINAEPLIGIGLSAVGTKAGSGVQGEGCFTEEIVGPACETCEEQEQDGCITRTAGFWKNHPSVRDSFDNAVLVCGESALNALCTSDADKKFNPTVAQLYRQIAAAKLNLAASPAGSCNGDLDQAAFANCEALLCATTGSKKDLTASQKADLAACINLVDTFNNLQDGVDQATGVFAHPGKADPSVCKALK
jgi:hypothetical protein